MTEPATNSTSATPSPENKSNNTKYPVVCPEAVSARTGMWYHWFGGKLSNGYGSSTTGEEVSAAIPKPSIPQTVIITGAAAGLGVETSLVLARRGCDVVMAVRDVAKGNLVAADIKKVVPEANLSVMKLDLADLNSVRQFVSDFKKTGKGVDILICNAGVAVREFQLSAQGVELNFATNHLGHYQLVTSLKYELYASAAKRGAPARVVVLSSSAHFRTYGMGVLPNDKISDKSSFQTFPSYAHSKLCNLLFVRELAMRWPKDKVIVTAVHPGVIMTELARDYINPHSYLASAVKALTRPVLKTVQQGIATTIFCALAPNVQSGEYYADCDISPAHPCSFDRALGQRLWTISENLTGATTSSQ